MFQTPHTRPAQTTMSNRAIPPQITAIATAATIAPLCVERSLILSVIQLIHHSFLCCYFLLLLFFLLGKGDAKTLRSIFDCFACAFEAPANKSATFLIVLSLCTFSPFCSNLFLSVNKFSINTRCRDLSHLSCSLFHSDSRLCLMSVRFS